MLLLYTAGLVALGLVIGRRVESTSGFFVAGRRLGPWLLFGTLMAANIGAGSTVGVAGLAYRDGLAAWWWIGSAGVGTLILAFWIGPRMWRIARRHDLRTVGDYLELRFGTPVRVVVTCVLWIGTLAILAGQIIAMAWILEAVAGVPRLAGAVFGGVVMTVYFAAGGLLTSAWVNMVQLVVILCGFLVCLPLAVVRAGGPATLGAMPAGADYWSLVHGGASGWPYLALLVPAFIVSPGLLQKIYGARDERTVRVGVGASGLLLLAFAAVPVLLGVVARSLHPGLASHELALPTLLVADLPPAIGLLGLAAVFSAELSTADAILFMLSTSLSQDLYRRMVNPQASDRQVLWVARGAALAGGVLGVVLAILLPTVIATLTIFYACLGVCLFVPILAGLLVRPSGVPDTLAAIGCGMAALLWRRLGGGPEYGLWTPNVVGLGVSVLAFTAVLAARRITRRTA